MAGRSAEAAKNTGEMLQKSKNRVNTGVKQSANTSESFRNIAESISTVMTGIVEILQNSNEQAEDITRIQGGIESIYRGSADNSSAVQTNASVSEELSGQANMLMALVDRFKIKK